MAIRLSTSDGECELLLLIGGCESYVGPLSWRGCDLRIEEIPSGGVWVRDGTCNLEIRASAAAAKTETRNAIPINYVWN